MKKILDKITTWAMVIIIAWGFLSWGEICCKNLNKNPQYSEYNLIINVFEWADEHIPKN